MSRLLRLSFVLLLLAGVQPGWAASQWQLTLLHDNDLHGMMLPFDYPGSLGGGAGPQANVGGMARRATLIARLRKEIGHPLLLVDAGDVFTRGPWHKRWYGVPEIEAMNLMHYDLLCVGNNEFKALPDARSEAKMLVLVQRSHFPWVAANLTLKGTQARVPGVQPFVVRTFGRVRVGLLGLTVQDEDAMRRLPDWQIGDPIAAARHWVPLARKRCDVLIAVTHLGEMMDRQLATQVAGIDAIIGGHSHTFLPHPVWEVNPAGVKVPIVQAGEHGIVLGRLDLTFEHAGAWHLLTAEERLLPITNALPEDLRVQQLLARYLGRSARKAAARLRPAWALGQ